MTTITIVRAGGLDADGDPVDASVEFEESSWFFAPASRAVAGEDNDRAQRVIAGLTGYGPYGSQLRASDRVRVKGALWDVDGEVGVWESPFPGAPEGVEAAFKRVTG